MKGSLRIITFMGVVLMLMQSCSPSIDLDARWRNPDVQNISPEKVMILAIGQDLSNRRVAEDAFALAFEQQGFQAVSASDVMPPTFPEMDSTQVRRAVKEAGADALATVRAVDVSTEQYWVPGTTYYPPYYGSYYGYHYNYGYYGASSPGYMDTQTNALLETNLYSAENGDLIWVGQSNVIVSGSVEKLASKYAAVVVRGMMQDGALIAQ